ncbi:hypothetical protein E2C01_025632 [Portunus trituberculatus]|uniref:Uncharacterized protein n=1 Tax=Portunus trituberculatus TaxID=210409 RepID=A0A5B7EDV3_PORTR|nr:hypothetical protein [Portunus trituberculatus]
MSRTKRYNESLPANPALIGQVSEDTRFALYSGGDLHKHNNNIETMQDTRKATNTLQINQE